MSRWSALRALSLLAGSATLWAALAGLCLLVGSTGRVGLPSRDVLIIRLEPVLMASFVGASLAAAGVVYQTVLRNPLADPYLLGVSSGASLFTYLWQSTSLPTMLAAAGAGGEAAGAQAFGFAGALLSMAVVLALASNRGRLEPVTLILVGVVVNAINASTFLFLNALQRDRPGAGGPLAFLVGGINTAVPATQKTAAAAVAAAGWLALAYVAGQLNVARLGEAEAEALGVRIQRLRWFSLVIASLVTAAAVALSGPIAFVGLVCPHLARRVVGPDVRRLLPVSTALGAVALSAADAATRYLAADSRAQTMMPVGVLTGFLGGPFFLLILWRSRRRPAAGGL